MAKKNKREEILTISMRLFLTQGYNNVGISDILRAAGVPKGSFYYYFSSKEDLTRQTIVHYANEVTILTSAYPKDMYGMRAFFARQFEMLEKSDYREGFPIGIITSELASYNEEVREEVIMMEREVHDFIKHSLINSFHFNDNRASDYALYIMFSFQGAILKAKLERSNAPLKIFERFIFDMLLRRDSKEMLRDEKTSGRKRDTEVSE